MDQYHCAPRSYVVSCWGVSRSPLRGTRCARARSYFNFLERSFTYIYTPAATVASHERGQRPHTTGEARDEAEAAREQGQGRSPTAPATAPCVSPVGQLNNTTEFSPSSASLIFYSREHLITYFCSSIGRET